MAQPKWRKTPAKKLSRSQRKKIAKRNKRAGSDHEREEMNRYGRYFHDLATSRYTNQHRDGCGIDLCNKNELKHGRFPIEVSCKTAVKSVPFQGILASMQGDGIRVLHFKRTAKPEGGSNFMTQGEYVIMYREGYEQFLQHMYAVQLLRNTHPELITALEKKFDLQLLNVPQQVHLQKPIYNDSTD
jgi:hypothetical protein